MWCCLLEVAYAAKAIPDLFGRDHLLLNMFTYLHNSRFFSKDGMEASLDLVHEVHTDIPNCIFFCNTTSTPETGASWMTTLFFAFEVTFWWQPTNYEGLSANIFSTGWWTSLPVLLKIHRVHNARERGCNSVICFTYNACRHSWYMYYLFHMRWFHERIVINYNFLTFFNGNCRRVQWNVIEVVVTKNIWFEGRKAVWNLPHANWNLSNLGIAKW